MYASELYGYAGIEGNQKLLMTAMLGVVKFVFAYIGAFFIIDFLGRRKAMYLGISLQTAALLYFALFLAIVPQAAEDGTVLTDSQRRASEAAVASILVCIFKPSTPRTSTNIFLGCRYWLGHWV